MSDQEKDGKMKVVSINDARNKNEEVVDFQAKRKQDLLDILNEMKIRIFKDIAITLSGLTKLNEIAYHLGLSPELLSNTKEVDELLGTLISEKSPHQI